MRVISRRDLIWKGDRLYINRLALSEIYRDATYPEMWRVKLPEGGLSDMVNRTRAKEAAFTFLNCQENGGK